MKMRVQMFTKQGFYGPEQEVQIRNVAEASGKLVSVIEKLPDELEGVSCMDWTRITVEIVRE